VDGNAVGFVPFYYGELFFSKFTRSSGRRKREESLCIGKLGNFETSFIGRLHRHRGMQGMAKMTTISSSIIA